MARTRQSLRAMDDAALELVAAEAARRLADVERRRKALGWSRERLCAGACVNRRTLERALAGQYVPEAKTIFALSRAVFEAEREARRTGPIEGERLRLLFEATCRTAALAFGLDPAAVVAVRPADNRPRDAGWLALVRAKHAALYALVMTDRVSMTAAAVLAGVSKQAVSEALRGVEERREDPEFSRRLQLVELR